MLAVSHLYLFQLYLTMAIGTSSNEFRETKTSTAVFFASKPLTLNNASSDNAREESIRLIQSAVASLGIIRNLTVIAVFLNHKKSRRKITNIFIINQVRTNNT